MAEVELEGSGVMEEAEESLSHVQHWDEDVVDLEFKSDDLVDLLSKSRNGSTLDYELFKKTDQVDSFLRQELNSIYQNATTTGSIFAEILTKDPPAAVFNSTPSSLVTTLSHILAENGSPGDTFATGRGSDAELDDFAEHYLSTSEPDSFYDEEDKSLDASDSDSVSYIFITILIITISFVSLSILIVMFIRHKAFFLSHNKDDNIGLSSVGPGGRGRGAHPDNSRFVVNISSGGGGGGVSSPKSTVVEMTQNQHQVSIIGSPRSRMKQFALDNTDTCPGHVTRSYSSSSHVSSHAPHFSGQERTSPEGRSVGDLEQDSDKDSAKVGVDTSVAVHVMETEDTVTKYEDCSMVSRTAPEDLTSFSSGKYKTPPSTGSPGSEYKSPEELFADIGIKFIDENETDEQTFRDDDTSVSSFSSTYQTPSSTEGEGGKMTRDLSREIQESGELRHELAKHVDITSLNTSEISGYSFHSTKQSNSSSGSRRPTFGKDPSLTSYSSAHNKSPPGDNDNVTITQDPVKATVSKSSSRKKDSEASFYSLYTAGSSLSIDLDIWEQEVGVDKNERKNSKSSENSSKDLSEKNSKGSHNSYSEFCKDTTTWLEEDVFCAPKATVDNFEDDEIVSSFSKFNQLMEKIKETKMSDLSDFDEKHDEPEVIKPEPAIIEKPTKTSCSTESSSNSSSTHEVNGDHYTQICSSEEGECCVSPLLGVDSSPEISTDVDNEDNIIYNEEQKKEGDENCSSDSDTEIDVTAFKKLILSSAVADEKLKKIHCQSPLSAVTTTKLIQKEKSKLDKNVSEFLI